MWPLVVVGDFIFSMSTGLQNAKLAKKNFIQQNVGPYWYISDYLKIVMKQGRNLTGEDANLLRKNIIKGGIFLLHYI